MSNDSSEYTSRMVMAYGTAPVTLPQQKQLLPDRFQPIQPVIVPSAITKEVTVSARVDEEGKLWLRISVDGVHVTEVVTMGNDLTLTEKI